MKKRTNIAALILAICVSSCKETGKVNSSSAGLSSKDALKTSQEYGEPLVMINKHSASETYGSSLLFPAGGGTSKIHGGHERGPSFTVVGKFLKGSDSGDIWEMEVSRVASPEQDTPEVVFSDAVVFSGDEKEIYREDEWRVLLKPAE